ncbi:hypothetical protein LSTR_LSTR012237 [Laodelphax striatellus]|uniref:Uncharacterized protein n=1 Tax=Laodelphax striatellus TaxID=195883 RepID=A0A482X8E0_LAOST|nr:hypothetical protein LSTR_LSTR012237 [Laodelphax striatellus]
MNASAADDYSFLADVWEKVTSAEIFGENVLKVSAEVMMWTCFFAIIEYVYEMLVEMKKLDKRELRDCRTAASVKKSEEGEEEKEGIGKRPEEEKEGDEDEENGGIVKVWHGGIRHGEESIEQKCDEDENNGIGEKCDDGEEKNKEEGENEEEREIEKKIGGKDNLETETNVMNKEMICVGDKDEENDGIVKVWHGGIRHGEESIEQKCDGDENNGIGKKCDDGEEKNKEEGENEEEREIEKNIGGKDNLETETNVMNKEMIGGKDNFETETNVINEEVTELDGKCLRKRILRVD